MPTVRGRTIDGRTLLLGACGVQLVLPAVVSGLRQPLGFDEAVYVSQLARHGPTLAFTAQRARGVPLLVAPVVVLTSSVPAIRAWLSLVSAVGWFVAFRPWQRLMAPVVPVVAALLLSSLWLSMYYGEQAMPNLFVALGAVAAAGHVGRWRAGDRDRSLGYAALAIAVVALLRPSDSVYLTLPLLAVVALPGQPWRRRAAAAGVLVAGLVAGWLEWVVEAEVRFGGLGSRLHASSEDVSGGLHWALGLQARAAAGPIVCRPCTEAVHPWALAWWVVGALLVGCGVAGAAAERRWALLLAVTVAVVMLTQYIVTLDFAVPRFLLPADALLSLPAAAGLVGVTAWARRLPSRRTLAVGCLVAALVAHVAVQVVIARDRIVAPNRRDGDAWVALAAALHGYGVDGRCVVLGVDHAPVAADAGCTDDPTSALDTHGALRPVTAVAVVQRMPAPPGSFYAAWRRVPLNGPGLSGWYAYLHPHGGTVSAPPTRGR